MSLTREVTAGKNRVHLSWKYKKNGEEHSGINMNPTSARALAKELVVAAEAAENWQARVGAVSISKPNGELSLIPGGKLSVTGDSE